MDDDTLPEPDALAALLAADAAHGDGCGWLSSRALAPDGTDQPMNLQRKTMYRDIDGFDAAEVPAVMASFVSLFLRTKAVRQFGLPIAEFFIWSDDWEYTRRISRAKPCYVIPASRVVHAMQNPGVVNIARMCPPAGHATAIFTATMWCSTAGRDCPAGCGCWPRTAGTPYRSCATGKAAAPSA